MFEYQRNLTPTTQRYTNADLKIFLFVCVQIKTIP